VALFLLKISSMKFKRDAYKVYLAVHGVEWFLDSLFVTVVFVYRATHITSDPFQLTLIEVVFTITLILSEIPTGLIADVFSRRLSVIIGFVLTGVAAILQGGILVYEVILVSQVIWAVGFTFISGAKDAWIADEIGEERAGKAYLRGSQISQVAVLIGIPIATALGTVSLNLPILLAGCLHLLLALTLVFIMPEEGFRGRKAGGQLNTWREFFRTFKRGLQLVRGRPVLVAIFMMSAVFGLSSMGFDNLWTVHMLENLTFPEIGSFEPVVWFGGINIAVSVLGLAGTGWAHRKLDISKGREIVRALTFLTISTTLGMVIFGVTRVFWLAVAAYCLSLTFRTVSMPLITTWINQNTDSSVRATVLSMDEQFFSLGETVGGPSVGAVGSLVSLPAALVTTGLARLPAAVIFVRYLLQGKTSNGET
jgi:DHA3 family tetracycline resistance protein-like MFS transporter